MNINLTKVKSPKLDCSNHPIIVSDKTIEERKNKVLNLMKDNKLDTLFVYADIEHGNNFEYLVGFLPRFEEAVLVLHQNGEAFLLLGNENLNKASKARIKAEGIHVPSFSLPNQPMINDRELIEVYKDAKITKDLKVGIVGWKNFTGQILGKQTYDVPYYILENLNKVTTNIENAAYIFIGDNGARITNNANEIASFEYFASLASDNMLKAMDALDVGVSEIELATLLNKGGQRNSVVTIAASGERFVKGNMYPTDKKVEYGDKISLTVGYRGGLSSRAGYAATYNQSIDKDVDVYLDNLVKPYYKAIVTWLENVKCGIKGKEIYDMIEEVLPKEKYHWSLNPGHLTAYEEWLSSPIYDGSNEILKSGMIFQTDIIPSLSGYGGTSVESTVLLTDLDLRNQIAKEYPEMYARMMDRKDYIVNTLGINLSEDLLPMCSTLAYLRPLLLDKEYAMRAE